MGGVTLYSKHIKRRDHLLLIHSISHRLHHVSTTTTHHHPPRHPLPSRNTASLPRNTGRRSRGRSSRQPRYPYTASTSITATFPTNGSTASSENRTTEEERLLLFPLSRWIRRLPHPITFPRRCHTHIHIRSPEQSQVPRRLVQNGLRVYRAGCGAQLLWWLLGSRCRVCPYCLLCLPTLTDPRLQARLFNDCERTSDRMRERIVYRLLMFRRSCRLTRSTNMRQEGDSDSRDSHHSRQCRPRSIGRPDTIVNMMRVGRKAGEV